MPNKIHGFFRSSKPVSRDKIKTLQLCIIFKNKVRFQNGFILGMLFTLSTLGESNGSEYSFTFSKTEMKFPLRWEKNVLKRNYILQTTSLVAQTPKKMPTMHTTQVWSLGQEDPLEKGMVTHSGFLPGESMDRGASWATDHGLAESDLTKWLTHICYSSLPTTRILEHIPKYKC